MPLRNRLSLAILLILLVVLLTIVFAPFAVSNGLRLWIWWAARQEGFVASIDKVDASFLRPVVIRQLHLKSVRDNAFRVDLTATRSEEHTSELQSQSNLVCRLLLETKK